MADRSPGPAAGPDTDLVEYVIIAVPDTAALGPVAEALAGLVEAGVVRVLDLVVMVRGTCGCDAVVLELEAVETMSPMLAVEGEVGGYFSAHDIELASLTMQPDTAALLLLIEDRWAGPLAASAREAGGRLLSGERIPYGRLDAGTREPWIAVTEAGREAHAAGGNEPC